MSEHDVDRDGVPLAVGDAVQVFNPGPLSRGTIIEFDGPTPSGYQRIIHVRWTDGSDGWPLLRLIRKVETPQ